MLRFPTTLFLVHPTSSWSEAVTDPDYAPTVATCPNDHTMGDSLYGYLDPKVHEWIKNKTYNRIYVVGDSDRTTGVSQNDKEFESFWKAIEFVEGWDIGKEEFIEKWIISGVHKKRGTIFEYRIRKPKADVWIQKEETICLANDHRLHAVIVHLKNETTYLRPEYGTKPFELIT